MHAGEVENIDYTICIVLNKKKRKTAIMLMKNHILNENILITFWKKKNFCKTQILWAHIIFLEVNQNISNIPSL